MNEFLLYSSIITGFMMLLIIYFEYDPKYNILYLCILLGIITSILNHGSDSELYKYTDRFIIILNIFVFVFFIMKMKNYLKKYIIAILIFVSSLLYLFSKVQKNIVFRNYLHSFSHFLSIILLKIIH